MQVCLTAARKSLHVDGNCRQMCAFLPAKAADAETSGFVVPTTKEECESERVAGDFNSTADPPTCTLRCQSLKRPLVPGCYNLDACMVSNTKECLCKPTCNLVPPNELSYEGYSGLNGTCNDAGQCCRLICAGFSRADLHPEPDMPRDGSARAEDMYLPNKLDQQWTLESKSGQISFKVGAFEDDKVPLSHSYKGGMPADFISTDVDIVPGDKDTLELLFHPGGDNAPKEELFAVTLKGPGTPEEAEGQFLWIRSPIYLMLPRWMLEILSFGLLAPSKKKSNSGINPGFCPVKTQEGSVEFIRRSILMYQALLTTFEYWKQPSKKTLPSGSLLVYKPVSTGNQSLVFSSDPLTGAINVRKFNVNEYPLTTAMLIVGLLIPITLATAVAVSMAAGYRRQLFEYRRVTLTMHAVMTKGIQSQQLLQCSIRDVGDQVRRARAALQSAKAKGADKVALDKLNAQLEHALDEKVKLEIERDIDKEEAEEVSTQQIHDMIAQTSFFYMCDVVIQDPERMRSVQVQILVAVQNVFIAYLPTVLPLYVLSLYKTALLADKCEFRSDRCTCLNEPEALAIAMDTLVSIHWVIAAAELGLYYLKIPYSTIRKVCRLVFYVSMSFFVWLSLACVTLLGAWTFLGLTIKPLKAGPFVIAGIGIILYAVFTFVKHSAFQTRVAKALTKGVQVCIYTLNCLDVSSFNLIKM